MSFQSIPQSAVQVGNFSNTNEYFCMLCFMATGQPRNIDGTNQFVDIAITKSQALQLLEQLHSLIETQQ
ncbi:MAG TPA: hypothetical protein V6D25_02660 [Leptolyngbyaceae cyanobacterium]